MKQAALPFALLTALFSQEGAPEQPSKPTMEFDGLIEASRVVYLSAPVDGILETVNVDRNDFVTKGQIVAALESTVEEATVEITVARSQLVAEKKKQEARVEYSTSKFEHDEQLRKKGILSEEELALGKTDKLLAEAGYIQAEENLRLADLERKRAKAVLERRTIRSPIDGIVVERFLSPGELVTRQYQSKIIAIAQVDPLIVDVMLPDTLFGEITPKMTAVVKLAIDPRALVDAEVRTVDQVIDSASGTFRVRLEMPNPENRIPAGTKCRVRFQE